MLKSCKNMCSYFTHTNAHTLAQKQNIHLISCPHVTTAVLRKMSKIISWLYYQNKIGGKILSTIWAHKPFADQEPRDIRMIMMIMIMVMMIMIMMTIKIIIMIIKRSLKSPATRRFIQYIVQTNDKENIKMLHFGPLWGHQSLVTPHKVPVIRMPFTCHDVIILEAVPIRPVQHQERPIETRNANNYCFDIDPSSLAISCDVETETRFRLPMFLRH